MSNSWKMWQEDIQCNPTCRYYCRDLTYPCTYIGWGCARPCETTANTPCSGEQFARMFNNNLGTQKTEVNENDIYRR